MKLNKFKVILPYLGAIVLFIVISIAYFNPLIEGKIMKQQDIVAHKGMSQEIVDHRAKFDEEPLWTNSMFSGMPAYQISTRYPANKISWVDKYLGLGLPRQAGFLFVSLLGFYFLLLALRVNKWLSIAGAIAFAFSSYFFIILEAGHNSKAHTIAYMAPVLAGIFLTLRGKNLLVGGILTALALALQLRAGHPQITYYLVLLVLVVGGAEFIWAVKEKRLPSFLKSIGVLVLAAGLAFGTNITSTLTTLEYGSYTMRGKSELTSEEQNRTSGLDKDYALAWSYGVDETLTMLVPDFKGGSSNPAVGDDSSFKKFLRKYGIKEGNLAYRMYWGAQPFTSGPVYVGAIVFFLFILGLIIVPGRLKWGLLIATLLSIGLAWGKNFMFLSDLFLDYFPAYNKFRAVAMTLVIAQLTMPLLGFLGLQQLTDKAIDAKKKLKALYISGASVAGLLLIIMLFSGSLKYTSESDASAKNQLYEQIVNTGATDLQAASFVDEYMDSIVSDRKDALRSDAFRSLIFILLGFALIWIFLKNKLNLLWVAAILPILILADMWGVSRRYLNEDSYENERKHNQRFTQTEADRIILTDTTYFRVLNLTTNTFNESTTSYWHHSIGGYHGAKFRRYQELIEAHIQKMNMGVLNMLNTKYVITQGQDGRPSLMPNTQHMGNAWFVPDYKIVENADSELAALEGFNPGQIALIDQRFEDELESFVPGPDSLASIELTEYRANLLRYKFSTSRDQLAIFSEIYYPLGWNAYIDGELIPHFRANYVLRAMILPAGSGELVFKFEPKTYKTGETISTISSLALILLALALIALMVRSTLRTEE